MHDDALRESIEKKQKHAVVPTGYQASVCLSVAQA
jgi:hypothetical protein